MENRGTVILDSASGNDSVDNGDSPNPGSMSRPEILAEMEQQLGLFLMAMEKGRGEAMEKSVQWMQAGAKALDSAELGRKVLRLAMAARNHDMEGVHTGLEMVQEVMQSLLETDAPGDS